MQDHPLDKLTISNVTMFLSDVFKKIDEKGIDVSDLYLDHICYRVSTHERYQELKKTLEDHGKLLVESDINGRLISTYKLKDPICFEGREITVLELPSPKVSSEYKEGYEHVEFVIPCSLKEFIFRYPDISFSTKGLLKKVNKDIRLSFDSVSVKFHEISLEEVIEMEKGIL